jgi:hypothetical protein
MPSVFSREASLSVIKAQIGLLRNQFDEPLKDESEIK